MLVALRSEAKLSQREIADQIGVPHTWVSKIETGERRIDAIELKWFCDACNADMITLLRRIFTSEEARPNETALSPSHQPSVDRKGRR